MSAAAIGMLIKKAQAGNDLRFKYISLINLAIRLLDRHE